MKIDIRIDSKPVAPPPPPKPKPYRVLTVPNDGGRYMLLLDDWDTDRWGRMPRSKSLNYKKDPPWNALPATIPTQKLFYSLNREWQFFYAELCFRANEFYLPMDVMLKGYKNTTRDAGGWRDRHTWNNVKDPPKVFTDYVLGLNVPPAFTEGDAAQQDLLSSGNIVKVLGEDLGNAALRLLSRAFLGAINRLTTRAAFMSTSQNRLLGISSALADAGAAKWIIETLDPFKPPPSVNEVWGRGWLVGFLTLSAYDWDKDIRARLKWPFFEGYGCPHMSLGRGGRNVVPKYWCKPIANGAEYSLYT